MERSGLAAGLLLLLASCTTDRPGLREEAQEDRADVRPSILLVTLDTTRADSLGFESSQVETPSLEALAARGIRFLQAWTTAPMTLPAHTSMLTGLYPVAHGIHENSRFLGSEHALLAEKLSAAGYRTAAFVSGYPLSRSFGLARGFRYYDDELGPGLAERRAGETTDRAVAYLDKGASGPDFVWVHYFDPHDPYEPPEPFRYRYSSMPYLGEIAYMDQEVGRLVEAFENSRHGGSSRIVVVGDHGEGLGDHGERLHGRLLYQGVMRVPMILAGQGIPRGEIEVPVSTRRVFDTVLAWAGLESSFDLLAPDPEIVLAEAMKPYLQYGWQPQVMAVKGTVKVIQSGTAEVYDLQADPEEKTDLARERDMDPEIRDALASYGLPSLGESAPLDDEARARLASLGYVATETAASRRENAPSARAMAHLFDDLDQGSELFVQGRYGESMEIFQRILAEDGENLMVTVRLAVAHSLLGQDEEALALFQLAGEIDPQSLDLKHYLAMHHFRSRRWDRAEPLLAEVLEAMPQRLPALETLARIREVQQRPEDAVLLLERVIALKPSPAAEYVRLGELNMAMGRTEEAIAAFESAWSIQGEGFRHFLELGVCYLAGRRPGEAAQVLDLVPTDHPGYSMALFKRAQASVLLGEEDQEERVRLAYELADPEVRRLIRSESLFQGVVPGL